LLETFSSSCFSNYSFPRQGSKALSSYQWPPYPAIFILTKVSRGQCSAISIVFFGKRQFDNIIGIQYLSHYWLKLTMAYFHVTDGTIS